MLIGRKYINFFSKAYSGKTDSILNYDLTKNMGKNGTLLFFVHQDFYPISTSEIIELNQKYQNFVNLGINPIIISVDSELTHQELVKNLKDKKTISNMSLDFVSDISKEISRDYLVLFEEGYSLPSTIFIDKKGIIKYFSTGSVEVKRDIDSILKTIATYQ